MKAFMKIWQAAVPASFTIETSIIIPIVLTITVWFITTSFTIHDNILSFSEAVCKTIKNAPAGDTASSDGTAYADRINIENLDGRKVLLKYKLLAEGFKALTGGLDDED